MLMDGDAFPQGSTTASARATSPPAPSLVQSPAKGLPEPLQLPPVTIHPCVCVASKACVIKWVIGDPAPKYVTHPINLTILPVPDR